MGLESDVAANGHRYQGLRGFGFGASVEMSWPEHPVFPNYGYTITRFNLDGLVAQRAENLGAVLLNGVEAVGLIDPIDSTSGGLRAASGVSVVEKSTGVAGEIRGRYLIVGDGQNSRLGRDLGTIRNRDWPGYGWIFPLGDGRVNVGVGLLSTGGAWKGVNTTKLQEYFVAQTADAWGLNDASCCGPATGGRLPMGLSLGPRTGVNTLTIGDAAGTVNPFNGEGIAYGYETGRLAAGAIGEALLANDPAALCVYDERLDEAYGDYFRLARAFVRVISEPKILTACVGLGMRVEPLMKELLSIMANLMRNDKNGPAELGYRALSRLADAIPERVYQLLLGDSSTHA
jgi:flavin-dependent dehydrogenase